MDEQQPPGDSAFGFHGDWREFAPIAFTNLLLTIVTLGIYTFWARARERRYLWSRTRFIDERLEWTGTGLELFIGYLMAIVFFLLPLVGLQFLAQSLVIRGQDGLAALMFVVLYFGIFYLVGVAIFRALRYRLSRTFWHGIRGGSDTQGFGFGLSYLWRTILGTLALGLMVPWAMTTLWNKRWEQMSFGPFRFTSRAEWTSIIGRYLVAYLSPIALIIVFGVIIGLGAATLGMSGMFEPGSTPEDAMAMVFVAVAVFYILFFVVLALIALYYYSAFYREAVGGLTLGELGFAFTARTKDWLLLVLGNIGLVIVTLGVGMLFVPYRNWKFFITHLEAYGELDLADLTQSTTREPGQGEGLLDAFDVGAI